VYHYTEYILISLFIIHDYLGSTEVRKLEKQLGCLRAPLLSISCPYEITMTNVMCVVARFSMS